MNHPAELALHQYMTDAVNGKSTMAEDTINQVALDVADALSRQFGKGKSRDAFRLRMSNLGRPTCQLWYDKKQAGSRSSLTDYFYDEHDAWRYR